MDYDSWLSDTREFLDSHANYITEVKGIKTSEVVEFCEASDLCIARVEQLIFFLKQSEKSLFEKSKELEASRLSKENSQSNARYEDEVLEVQLKPKKKEAGYEVNIGSKSKDNSEYKEVTWSKRTISFDLEDWTLVIDRKPTGEFQRLIDEFGYDKANEIAEVLGWN